jgi:Tfp pilus assembly protein PilN
MKLRFNVSLPFMHAKSTLSIAIFDEHLLINTSTSNSPQPITVNLTPNTIYQGILYKPTALIDCLAPTLKKLHLVTPIITVHLPPSIKASTPLLSFIVLQYTLTFSKANIRITKATHSIDQHCSENLLTRINNPNTRSPLPWFLTTLTFLCAICLSATIRQQKILINLNLLVENEKKIKIINKIYEKQFQEINTLDATIKQLQKRNDASHKILNKIRTPNRLLKTIAQNTPTSIWLKSVTIEHLSIRKRKFNKTQSMNIEQNINDHQIIISGTSTSSVAVTRFLKNLSQQETGIDNPVLIKITKAKQFKKMATTKITKHEKPSYHFIIDGTLSNKQQPKN